MSGEKKWVVDFSGAQSAAQIHERLKAVFDFPDHYGKNWDALNDCLNDLLTDGGRHEIEIRGFYEMDAELRAKCAPMLTVFGDVQEEWGNLEITVVS